MIGSTADRVRRLPGLRIQSRGGPVQGIPVDGVGQKMKDVAPTFYSECRRRRDVLVQRVLESHAEEILLPGWGLRLSFHSCPVFRPILAVYRHPINILFKSSIYFLDTYIIFNSRLNKLGKTKRNRARF